jgi:hypothetical protein
VVERSDLSVQDIATRFGCLVADLVATLTDDPGTEGFVESKEAQRQEVAEAGELGQAIFAADRASNARELTRLISTRGIEGAKRDKTGPGTRLRLWQRDLEMLEAHAPKLSRLPEMRAAIRDFAAVVVGLRAREYAALSKAGGPVGLPARTLLALALVLVRQQVEGRDGTVVDYGNRKQALQAAGLRE